MDGLGGFIFGLRSGWGMVLGVFFVLVFVGLGIILEWSECGLRGC